MDIEVLKQLLEVQLENNGIRRGTKAAHTFEYAFTMGAMAAMAAMGKEPPVYLTLLAMTGRSLFDVPKSPEVMQ